MKDKIYKIVIILAIFSLVSPLTAFAAMRSENYVIYETVMHNFDGPTISNVNSSVSGITATITWDTNIIADGFVIYDTVNTFTGSKEAGNSAKISTSHSVEITGLEANQVYYYKVRSERINGGITTDNTVRTFTTGADPNTPSTPPAATGGGGILIIDKTDKTEPEITDITVNVISDKSVEIRWKTNEAASSFIEYGSTAAYGATYGSWASTTDHVVKLENLEGDKDYHFRALSSDSWGNLGRSSDQTFTTKPLVEDETAEETEETEEEQSPNVLEEASRRVIQFMGRLFPAIETDRMGANPLQTINNVRDLANLIPAPILSGSPRVEIAATEVKFFWNTDIDANGLVAIATDEKYNADATEPYMQIVGDPESMSTEHEVTVLGLTPDTNYHYQIRSKAQIGPTARSRDFTFKTSLENLKIVSFFTKIIDQQTATIKWVTNKASDSMVEFAPYHGNTLAIDETKNVKDSVPSVIHEIKISDFEPGVFYNIEISSMDDEGNLAKETLERFSTAEDDLPPEISHIKADSTVFLDQDNKSQTIISWATNEPSTSQIFYQEGVQGRDVELSSQTEVNTNYTKEHVMVISKFKPGVVYSFRVESVDSGGNVSRSNVHTFMTAKKKESIIQVIMRILEETFSWVKKLS